MTDETSKQESAEPPAEATPEPAPPTTEPDAAPAEAADVGAALAADQTAAGEGEGEAAPPAAEGEAAPPAAEGEAAPPAAEGEVPPPAPAPAPNEAAAPAVEAPPAAPAPAPRKRPPRPREPLPWPELRSAATAVGKGLDVNDLKELFRLLPADIRDETVEGVREYRKGARRPVSAHAGKSLARAIHTARRARRRPESDEDVSAAIGQALAAEIIASLDVEIAAEVILPKRDLLERQARDARRKARDEQDRTRDERRRRARDEEASGGEVTTPFGTYSGAKIRGLDELKKLLEQNQD